MMPHKLGILAGGGQLPVRIIDACRQIGRPFFVVAFENQTDPATVGHAPHAWVRLGAGGKALSILRREDVDEIVLAGAIRRPSLHDLRPDTWTAKFLARTGVAMAGDNGILSALVREFEEAEGYRVLAAHDLLPDALASLGTYGAIEPDSLARNDIERGIEVARRIGSLDVGQAVVVQQGIVLALEAAEGTDDMLARSARLRRAGPGGVLVKIKKPGQIDRADLPTIGTGTVAAAADAGLRGIAVEAGGTLVIDRDSLVTQADEAGLFVSGVCVEETARG